MREGAYDMVDNISGRVAMHPATRGTQSELRRQEHAYVRGAARVRSILHIRAREYDASIHRHVICSLTVDCSCMVTVVLRAKPR
jgi:hypothetical protein